MIYHRLIRQTRGIVHLFHLTLLRITHIRYVGDGGNHIHIKLTIQTFLDNLHVEQSEETATETEAQSHRGLRLEGQRGIVKLQFLKRCTQVLIISRIDGIDTGEDHRLHFLESLNRPFAWTVNMGNGITHLYLL